MQSKWMAATGCLAALALGVAACGGRRQQRLQQWQQRQLGQQRRVRGEDRHGLLVAPAPGRVARLQTEAVNNGAKLALEQANDKAGDTNITVKYSSLDDSTAQAGTWTPEAESANARKAAQDKSTGVLSRHVQLGRQRRSRSRS